MKIVEMIGILVFQCECGQKFVINTECIGRGFDLTCKCGKWKRGHRGGRLDVSYQFASQSALGMPIPPSPNPLEFTEQGNREYQRKYDRYQKEYAKYLREHEKTYNNCNAMPLEEYKKMLASVILEGKKYRIAKEHNKVIKVHVDTVDYENLYATLRNLGFSKEEAIAKVDIAIEQGFIRDTEIIKYILSLE